MLLLFRMGEAWGTEKGVGKLYATIQTQNCQIPTVEFSSRCKWEKHVVALCCSTTTAVCAALIYLTYFLPPFPPLCLVWGEGRGDHQAGSSRLHSITAAYIHMLIGIILTAKADVAFEATQHSLFTRSHNRKLNKINKEKSVLISLFRSYHTIITDRACLYWRSIKKVPTACHT